MTGILFNASHLVWRAYNVAKTAHAGSFRRDQITEYIMHPLAVEKLLERECDNIRMVALLHDVLEDTSITEKDLAIDFPQEVIDAVVLLTHKKDESYEDYLKKVKENKLSCKVKIIDMLHNLSCNPTQKQVNKYLKGLEFLFKI